MEELCDKCDELAEVHTLALYGCLELPLCRDHVKELFDLQHTVRWHENQLTIAKEALEKFVNSKKKEKK